MFKAISLVRTVDGMPRDEFAKRWIDQFAPVAAQLPGLLGYTINVTAAESPSQEWTGFTELWFEAREDFDSAFAESALNAELDRLRPQFIATYSMYFVDETDIVKGVEH